MKKKILLFSLLLLASCSNGVETDSDKITDKKSDTIVETSSPEEEEPEIFDVNENSRRLVLSSRNKTNTSFSSYEAEYSKDGIIFHVQVKDNDLFYGNIYNIGYDDNFEFLINEKTDANGWDTAKTFHFLMNANGETVFERAISKNGLGMNYDSSLHVVKGENYSYEHYPVVYEDGHTGYKADVFLSYDVLNTTYEEGYGNISFCPGMRNSHDYGNDSTWSSYSQRGCKWASSSTFVLINKDGSFGEKLSLDIDDLYLGDTLFDPGTWTHSKYDIGEKSYNVAKENSMISYWDDELKQFEECKVKRVVIYLGSNDILKTEYTNVSRQLVALIAKAKGMFASSEVYYVCNVVTPKMKEKEKEILSLNKDMEEKCKEMAVNFVKMDQLHNRPSLYYSNGNMNYLGYNLFSREIRKALKKVNNLPSSLQGNDRFASGSAFKNENDEIIGYGEKDQYLIFDNQENTSLSFSMDISAKEVYLGDNYPKFGLVLLSETDTFFFYVDGSNSLTTSKVGYVKGVNHMSWKWANSIEKNVDIGYNNGNYVSMKLEAMNGNISAYVNGTKIFDIEEFFQTTEKLSAGFLTFNTGVSIKNIHTM